MSSKPNQYTRRILTFPAIRPCDDVSPAVLLGSLIGLAGSICNHKSEFFSSNKRNARESIRLIEILLVFFEEVRDRGLDLSDSVVLSFSELYFVFQKVQFLLEDCARGDSRLWILMKSGRVSNQLRTLIRTVSTALDVLPLASMEISVEVKESVDLVTKQARNLEFKIDADDESAAEDILAILERFEYRIVPDGSDLKRILDYLGIRSWSDCTREIKFFDSEIGFENLTVEKRDVTLLHSLLGLMCYCRSVLFDLVDNVATKQPDCRCSNDAVNCLNPDDFRCPISLDFMSDPVTLSSGHSYDKSSIQKWFKSGNFTCPKTGERLLSRDLIPNLALKRLISQYCSENGIPVADNGGSSKRDITGTVVAGSVAAQGAMKVLAKFLAKRLQFGANEEKNKAAYEIRLLTKSSIFNRSCLVDSNTIPHLLNLLFSTLAQENAIAALLNLSKHSRSKGIIVDNGGLELIFEVLKEGLKMEARQHAAGTLFYLASVEEYRVLIGRIPGVFPALMELVKDGSDRAKKNSLVAIFGLLMHPNNNFRALGAGLVPFLVNLLSSFEREDLVTDSLAILATLAESPQGTLGILKTGALHVVTEVLSTTSSKPAMEYCVSLLLALCVNGGRDVVALLVNNPSLMVPLYSLLAEGTSRASKKASSLIRMLHEFHEKSSSQIRTPAFPQERPVHVW